MDQQEEWVVWNGSLGVLDMATIGRIESHGGGRSAYLAPPYGVVGPFSLDDLEIAGRIAFGACLVMSRRRWREDQVELRLEARERRRILMAGLIPNRDERRQREILELPEDAELSPAEINAAFRRLAKAAHPDAGGSDAEYRRIAEARDSLLAQFTTAP